MGSADTPRVVAASEAAKAPQPSLSEIRGRFGRSSVATTSLYTGEPKRAGTPVQPGCRHKPVGSPQRRRSTDLLSRRGARSTYGDSSPITTSTRLPVGLGQRASSLLSPPLALPMAFRPPSPGSSPTPSRACQPEGGPHEPPTSSSTPLTLPMTVTSATVRLTRIGEAHIIPATEERR